MLPFFGRKQNFYINSRQAPNINAAVPVQTPLQNPGTPISSSIRQNEGAVPGKEREIAHISHCKVLNFTPSTLSLSPATSCSIRVSVSLILSSWLLASSLIRPFSKFRSSFTLACARPISSRRRDANLAKSLESRSWDAKVNVDSLASRERSSERSFVKSTLEL